MDGPNTNLKVLDLLNKDLGLHLIVDSFQEKKAHVYLNKTSKKITSFR